MRANLSPLVWAAATAATAAAPAAGCPARPLRLPRPRGDVHRAGAALAARRRAAELLPCATVTLALDAVRSGEADGAVVPIENSVEGSVPVTLDELATGEPLMITREMTVPIAFSLLARPGVRPEDVKVVATHPHAAAQTRRWVALNLPDAEVVHAPSTAAAAAAVADPESTWDAAIAARWPRSTTGWPCSRPGSATTPTP